MTTTPTAVLLRLSRFLFGRDRTPNLQAHRELAQTFALVAPLGGGAMVSLQALGRDGVLPPVPSCSERANLNPRSEQ